MLQVIIPSTLKGWIGVGSILFAIGCLLFKVFIV